MNWIKGNGSWRGNFSRSLVTSYTFPIQPSCRIHFPLKTPCLLSALKSLSYPTSPYFPSNFSFLIFFSIFSPLSFSVQRPAQLNNRAEQSRVCFLLTGSLKKERWLRQLRSGITKFTKQINQSTSPEMSKGVHQERGRFLHNPQYL